MDAALDGIVVAYSVVVDGEVRVLQVSLESKFQFSCRMVHCDYYY